MDKTREEAGIPHEWLLGGHFSPECLTQTIIMFLEMANGRGNGEHVDMPPCPTAGHAINEIVTGILEYLEKHATWPFTLEQPKGTALAKHKEINRLERALNIRPQEMRMCACGYARQKPTMIWHNLQGYWTPRSLTKHCEYCRNNTQHPMRIVRRNDHDKRPAAQLDGVTQEASRNRNAPRPAHLS